jgi:hypothetical protein
MERRKRKRRGSHRYQSDTDGDRGGTDRYRFGSDGYRAEQEPQPGEAEARAGKEREAEFDLAARFMEPSEGWWTRYGFESLGEYLRESETGRVRTWAPPKHKKTLPVPKLPEDVTQLPAPKRSGRRHQVATRLNDEGYEALVKAARIYGVAPSTLARLLIHRGAMAVVEMGTG